MLLKIYKSDQSFQDANSRFKRLDELGRGRTRKGRGTNETSLGQGKTAVGFESRLGAVMYGAELGATNLGVMIRGAEVCAM